MIVVDTNVLAHLWLPGELTAAAERVLDLDPAWAAPLLWRSEFRSVLTGALRRRALSLPRARQIAAAAERQLHGSEYAVSSAVVLELALRSRCSAYDCEYVALAADLGVPLVTNDHQVLEAFPERATSPGAFAGRAR